MRILIKAICCGTISEGIVLLCMDKGDWGPCMQEPDFFARLGVFLHWPGFLTCRLFSVSGRFDEYYPALNATRRLEDSLRSSSNVAAQMIYTLCLREVKNESSY